MVLVTLGRQPLYAARHPEAVRKWCDAGGSGCGHVAQSQGGHRIHGRCSAGIRAQLSRDPQLAWLADAGSAGRQQCPGQYSPDSSEHQRYDLFPNPGALTAGRDVRVDTRQGASDQESHRGGILLVDKPGLPATVRRWQQTHKSIGGEHTADALQLLAFVVP
ncbi:hypothetical protein D3C79_699970 [compost metagenome]